MGVTSNAVKAHQVQEQLKTIRTHRITWSVTWPQHIVIYKPDDQAGIQLFSTLRVAPGLSQSFTNALDSQFGIPFCEMERLLESIMVEFQKPLGPKSPVPLH